MYIYIYMCRSGSSHLWQCLSEIVACRMFDATHETWIALHKALMISLQDGKRVWKLRMTSRQGQRDILDHVCKHVRTSMSVCIVFLDTAYIYSCSILDCKDNLVINVNGFMRPPFTMILLVRRPKESCECRPWLWSSSKSHRAKWKFHNLALIALMEVDHVSDVTRWTKIWVTDLGWISSKKTTCFRTLKLMHTIYCVYMYIFIYGIDNCISNYVNAIYIIFDFNTFDKSSF